MAETPPQMRVPRPEETTPLEERDMALGWLKHLRASAIFKLEDLDAEQLRWKPTPAANSLGVIVVHLGYSERLWFRAIAAGEPMDMEWRTHMFDLPEGWGVDEVIAFYKRESALADALFDQLPSLDAPSGADFRPTTCRWALFHMIEETARHVGHMDITRELLDGRTGR